MANKKISQLTLLDRDAAAGDLVAGWDGLTNKTVAIDVSKLPGNGGGGGGGGGATLITVSNPFMVFTDSPNYAYDAGTNSVTISDTRLLNKVQYPVATTQFGGGELNINQMTYFPVDPADDTKGKVVISNFQLDDNAHITITIPGQKTIADDVQFAQLVADVTLLKVLTAPFKPTALGPFGGKVWWPRSAGDIPAGWQECVAMRGLLPIAQDPADAYDATTNPEGLSRDIGQTGGNKYHTNTLAEMVPHNHELQTSNSRASDNDGADPVRSTEGGSANSRGGIGDNKSIGVTGGVPDPITGVPAAQEYSIMNPYLIGIWIECIGV